MQTISDSQELDLQLLARMVAKRLSQNRGVKAPPATAYSIFDGRHLHVTAEIDHGLKLRLQHNWWSGRHDDLGDLAASATRIAESIADLDNQAPDIRGMLSEVTAATKREIAKARRRGLPYSFRSAEPFPWEVGDCGDFAIRVVIEALGCSLKAEEIEFGATCVADVAEAFERLKEVQTDRAERRAGLDRQGATGAVDAVVVAALQGAGLDMQEVLAEVDRTDDWIVDLTGVDGKRFRLFWKEGVLYSRLELAEGVSWSEHRLRFKVAPKNLGKRVDGKPLAMVFEHPHLDDRLVVQSSHGKKGDHGMVDCNPVLMLFDAADGRMWEV